MITSVSALPASVERWWEAPAVAGEVRRNDFRAVLEQTKPQPEVAHTRTAFTPPGAETRRSQTAFPDHARSAAAGDHPYHSPPPSSTPTSNWEGDFNPAWYTPITNPLPLDVLFRAMEAIGLNPSRFQFEQLQAEQEFPPRPEFNYVTRQLLVRGNERVALLDLDLVLRTPWVAAQELRQYGLVA